MKTQQGKQRPLGRYLGLLFLCLAVFGLFACSGTGPDSDSSTGPVSMKDVAGEKPITQHDIDVYIQILPELAPLGNNGQAAAKVYKKFGMSRVRFIFIQAKLPLCSSMILGLSFNENFDKLTESMKPIESELAVVRANWDDLIAAHKNYKQLSGADSDLD